MSYTCIQTHRGPTGRRWLTESQCGKERGKSSKSKETDERVERCNAFKINMAVTIKQAMRLKKRRFKRAATPQRK